MVILCKCPAKKKGGRSGRKLNTAKPKTIKVNNQTLVCPCPPAQWAGAAVKKETRVGLFGGQSPKDLKAEVLALRRTSTVLKWNQNYMMRQMQRLVGQCIKGKAANKASSGRNKKRSQADEDAEDAAIAEQFENQLEE